MTTRDAFPRTPDQASRAHTPAQKREIIERLLAAWEAQPEMRLGQLIANCCRDCYYVEDYDLLAALEAPPMRTQDMQHVGARPFPTTPDELKQFVRDEVHKALADLPRMAYAPPTLRNHGFHVGDVTPGKFDELPAWARQEETGRP